MATVFKNNNELKFPEELKFCPNEKFNNIYFINQNQDQMPIISSEQSYLTIIDGEIYVYMIHIIDFVNETNNFQNIKNIEY